MRVEDVTEPSPGVRNTGARAAAGVNPVDTYIRSGYENEK